MHEARGVYVAQYLPGTVDRLHTVVYKADTANEGAVDPVGQRSILRRLAVELRMAPGGGLLLSGL